MSWNKNILLFVLIITFFYPSILVAQINQIDKKGRKQGVWMKTYENSSAIRYKGQFIDDKPVGKFIYYFEDTKVKAIIIHDTLSDRAVGYFYYPNKAVASYGIFHGRDKDSIWTNFSPYGGVSSRASYKNGKLDGLKIMYYAKDDTKSDDLVVLKKLTYKAGVVDGPFVSFFNDGTKKSEGIYKNGALEGVVKKYNPNGKIRLLERYHNGNRIGWWITYDETGKEQGKRYFKDNEPLDGKALDKYMAKLKAEGLNPNHPYK